jgi:nucleoside diphosphate kinase
MYLHHGQSNLFLRYKLICNLLLHTLLKPDGVQRSLVGEIISRFEKRGFKLIALKLVHATPEHLEKRESRQLFICNYSDPPSIIKIMLTSRERASSLI